MIPAEDEYPSDAFHTVHPDLHPMLRAFSITVHGKLITVDYVLKVFVKHDSWNEFGEGKVVSLPIQIMQPPMQIISQQQVEAPVGWQP